ncbi:MAG: HAD hydrolase-like protein [Burkholderiales bacterium]|nr:HAD hydrolase-like protein [Burkholderiales bacterium]
MSHPVSLDAPDLTGLGRDALGLLNDSELVIADLDGSLAVGLVPVAGAADLAARLGHRLVIASNNSTHTSTQLSRVLVGCGLEIPSGRIFLAGETAVREVARRYRNARVMLLGSVALAEVATAAGLVLSDAKPDVVILARDLELSFARLQRAVDALAGGCTLVVSNPDLTHPGPGGLPQIETGSLLALVSAAVPKVFPIIIGKPERLLFDAALAYAGADPSAAVMVGDNLSTDIESARRLGLNTVWLRGRRHGNSPDATRSAN